MNKITIIPESGLVMIDGRGFDGLDMTGIPALVHAIQWNGKFGEIEYMPHYEEAGGRAVLVKRENEIITLMDAYSVQIASWETAKAKADAPPPEPTPEEEKAALIQSYNNAIESWMNAEAQSCGYDNIDRACSYASVENPFQAESQSFVKWRGAVWSACYQLMAEVDAGTRAIHTVRELMAMLPKRVPS